MKQIIIITLLLGLLLFSCTDRGGSVNDIPEDAGAYTCPMAEDSVFSTHPGHCPKCGMELVLTDTNALKPESPELGILLQPADEFVLSSIPVTRLRKRTESIELEVPGEIAYDSRKAGVVSATVSGRIEKLYVRYRYQKVTKGQKIFEIYSPELLTAQQNLLLLLNSDAGNTGLLEAARQRLRLLGMSSGQLQEVIDSRKPAATIAVYSNYSGHIQESDRADAMNTAANERGSVFSVTDQLELREGMYVQKGQSLLTVRDPGNAWVLLTIFGDQSSLVQEGDAVRIIPESAPDQDFRARIDFVEPFFQERNKTLTARVYFDNHLLKIPIGSQVRATIFGKSRTTNWLPREAVRSTGFNDVVFRKATGGFVPVKVSTGIVLDNFIQITGGLDISDSVAVNAQYLIDSEAFIKLKY